MSNKKLIDSVNKRIDNPSMWQMYMNSMQNQRYKNRGLLKNPYDIFGLTQSGHRKNNHDILTGALTGAMQARKMGLPASEGVMAAFSHFTADNFSNHLVGRMGVEGRNLFESLWAMNSNRYKRRFY